MTGSGLQFGCLLGYSSFQHQRQRNSPGSSWILMGEPNNSCPIFEWKAIGLEDLWGFRGPFSGHFFRAAWSSSPCWSYTQWIALREELFRKHRNTRVSWENRWVSGQDFPLSQSIYSFSCPFPGKESASVLTTAECQEIARHGKNGGTSPQDGDPPVLSRDLQIPWNNNRLVVGDHITMITIPIAIPMTTMMTGWLIAGWWFGCHEFCLFSH